MESKSVLLIILISVSVFLTTVPEAQATLYVNWSLATTEKGEFITVFVHLYSVPDGAKLYEKIDEVAAKITSAQSTIGKAKDTTKNMKSLPSDAEKLYRDAMKFFDDGKYPEAERKLYEE